MSRPSQERVEDGLITWQRAIYELHREIDKLDQEKEILSHYLADARLIASEQNDGHVAANLRNTHLEEKIRDLEFRLDAYRIAESLAASRIMDCHRAIVKFCDWAEDMLPMPVHPAIAGLMMIGRQLKKEPT